MNYYKHHIGDYIQATAHLSFIEDAAYCRLLRKYYADESPLPPDIKLVQKLVGARSLEEKSAVKSVLEEFFQLHKDGWRQKRCDEEIEEYRKWIKKSSEGGKQSGRIRRAIMEPETKGGSDLVEPETKGGSDLVEGSCVFGSSHHNHNHNHQEKAPFAGRATTTLTTVVEKVG